MPLENIELFFVPLRDDKGTAVLQPVMIDMEDFSTLATNRVVTDVEKALSMYAGFGLAVLIGQCGGLKETEKLIKEQKEDEE